MPIKCGLQMHTVREILRSDPEGTFEKVAETGFHYAELTGHDVEAPSVWYGYTAERLSSLAERLGVHIIGGYVRDLNENNADAVIKYYRDLGSERIVIPIGYFTDREMIAERCALYNTLGQMCQRNGLELCYENHFHEFQTVDGALVMDQLMAGTASSGMKLSLNNYWLMRGLTEPLDVLKRYASRITSLVLEDYPLEQIDKFNVWTFYRFHPIGKSILKDVPLKYFAIENINPLYCELFTEIGNGIFKLQELIDEANKYGNIRYVLLKQDYTMMPSEYDSIRVSYENCRKLSGLNWD